MMTTVQREQRLVGYNDRSSSSSNIGANKEQGPVELVAIRYPVIVTSTQQHRAMRLDGNNNYNNNNANNDNCIISIPPTQEGISGVEWSGVLMSLPEDLPKWKRGMGDRTRLLSMEQSRAELETFCQTTRTNRQTSSSVPVLSTPPPLVCWLVVL